jgi:GT2 family glycosyltransferase
MSETLQVSIAILAYNAESRIRRCLDAAINQTRLPDEIFVVDNHSADNTVEIIRQNYPSVRIHRTKANLGCAGGRNVQLAQATYPFILIVDDDAILGERCLEELENAVQRNSSAAIWAPRICYEQDRSMIQFDGGGTMHYVSEAILKNPNKQVADAGLCGEPESGNSPMTRNARSARRETLGFQGGVAFLIRKQTALDMGGYDEDFFFGRTDGEFSFRLMLEGNDIAFVPLSVAYHAVAPRGFSQLERQMRNRWWLMLKTYSTSTIVAIAPALLAYELVLLVFLATKGKTGAYLAAARTVIADLPMVRQKRRRFLPRKRRRDCDVLGSGRINIRPDIASGFLVRGGLAGVAHALSLYWSFARRILAVLQ